MSSRFDEIEASMDALHSRGITHGDAEKLKDQERRREEWLQFWKSKTEPVLSQFVESEGHSPSKPKTASTS